MVFRWEILRVGFQNVGVSSGWGVEVECWKESGTLEICWRAFVCKCGRPSLGSTTAPKKQQNALSWRRHFPRPEWRDLALIRRLSVTVLATLKLWFSTRWSHLTLAMVMAWLMYISLGTPTHSSVGSSLGTSLVTCLQVLWGSRVHCSLGASCTTVWTLS